MCHCIQYIGAVDYLYILLSTRSMRTPIVSYVRHRCLILVMLHSIFPFPSSSFFHSLPFSSVLFHSFHSSRGTTQTVRHGPTPNRSNFARFFRIQQLSLWPVRHARPTKPNQTKPKGANFNANPPNKQYCSSAQWRYRMDAYLLQYGSLFVCIDLLLEIECD